MISGQLVKLKMSAEAIQRAGRLESLMFQCHLNTSTQVCV